MNVTKWLQGMLSDFISLLFSPPENKEVHGWLTKIGAIVFLVFASVLGSMVR
jgi:hypothetical protein